MSPEQGPWTPPNFRGRSTSNSSRPSLQLQCARGCNACSRRVRSTRGSPSRASSLQPHASQPVNPRLQAATSLWPACNRVQRRARSVTTYSHAVSVRRAGRRPGDAHGRVAQGGVLLHASDRRLPGRHDHAQGRRVRRVARTGAARWLGPGLGLGLGLGLRLGLGLDLGLGSIEYAEWLAQALHP